MHSTRPVFLVGFMGSGKTTVGRALAARERWPFHDLDQLVEQHTGCALHELFEREGEARFRAHERTALAGLEPALVEGGVVATGGGAFADPVNRAWIEAHGVSVWLDAPFEDMWMRCAGDAARPLFGPREDMEELFEARRKGYYKARHRILTAGLGVDQIVERVLAALAIPR